MKISALTSFRVQHGNNSVNFAANKKPSPTTKPDTLELSNKKVIPDLVVITPEDYKKGIREITKQLSENETYTSIVDADGNQIGEHNTKGREYDGWRMYDNGWKITYETYVSLSENPPERVVIEGHNEKNPKETICPKSLQFQSMLDWPRYDENNGKPNLPLADELRPLMLYRVLIAPILLNPGLKIPHGDEKTNEKTKEIIKNIFDDPTTTWDNIFDRFCEAFGFDEEENKRLLEERAKKTNDDFFRKNKIK